MRFPEIGHIREKLQPVLNRLIDHSLDRVRVRTKALKGFAVFLIAFLVVTFLADNLLNTLLLYMLLGASIANACWSYHLTKPVDKELPAYQIRIINDLILQRDALLQANRDILGFISTGKEYMLPAYLMKLEDWFVNVATITSPPEGFLREEDIELPLPSLTE